MSEVRKYHVKQSWIFNLESMHDKCWCLIYDIRDGELKTPVEVAGKMINDEDDLEDLMEEIQELEWTAKRGKVTSKEYGRIKEIVNWRVYQRYATCVANGMNEKDAGYCFNDM